MAFPTTKWDVVDVLRTGDAALRQAALSDIVNIYAAPLLAFARAEFPGRQRQDYEDILQGFFLRCWEKNSLAVANPERGKFRSFLVTVFKNYVYNFDRDARAAIRWPAGGLVSADALFEEYGALMEPRGSDTPETIFERVYQHRVFRAALDEFRQRCEAGDQLRRYRLFLARAVTSRWNGQSAETLTHAELAEQFGLSSANASVKIFRSARAEFRIILMDQLGRSGDSADEIERECELVLAMLLND
jgi:RNA polymerase sigma factor (sigma-70 family)